LEYSSHDFAAKNVLARSTKSAGSLRVETGGDLARSPRWDEVMRRVGIGDIAAAACRDALGCWGWIEAYRDSSDRPFEQADLILLAKIGPGLGSALRRNAMRTSDGGSIQASEPGTIVLNHDLQPVSWTAGARAWIDALPSATLLAGLGMLPTVVYPAATLARSGATAAARALVQAVDGRWVMIEAARLEGERPGEARSRRTIAREASNHASGDRSPSRSFSSPFDWAISQARWDRYSRSRIAVSVRARP
jgi:hypothetical protein